MNCAVERCGRESFAKDLCVSHFSDWGASKEHIREMAWSNSSLPGRESRKRQAQAWRDFVGRVSAEERQAVR